MCVTVGPHDMTQRIMKYIKVYNEEYKKMHIGPDYCIRRSSNG